MTFWTFQKTFSRQLADWLVGVNNHANFCESPTHLSKRTFLYGTRNHSLLNPGLNVMKLPCSSHCMGYKDLD